MTELGGVACVSAETVVARALPEVPTLGLVYEDVVAVAEAEPKAEEARDHLIGVGLSREQDVCTIDRRRRCGEDLGGEI